MITNTSNRNSLSSKSPITPTYLNTFSLADSTSFTPCGNMI